MTYDKTNEQRDAEICRRYSAGETLSELARCFGLGRQRIQQIVKKGGVWKPYERQRDQFIGVSVSGETKEKLKQKAEGKGVSLSRLTSDALDELVKEDV